MRVVFLIALMAGGCAPSAPPVEQTLPVEAASPPGGDYLLTTTPWIGGELATIDVRGARPNTMAFLGIGAGGLAQGTCAPVLDGRCADVGDPLFTLGAQRTDVQGDVTFTLRVPDPIPGRFGGLQSVVLAGGDPLISNAVPVWLHPAGTVVASGVDTDGDGFSPPEDCNEASADVHPDVWDVLGDGLDTNCDGVDGAYDPGPPPASDTIGTLTIVIRTEDTPGAGGSSAELAVTASDFILFGSSPDWEYLQAGEIDVEHIADPGWLVSEIDRLEIGTFSDDPWRPVCAQLLTDGRPLACSVITGVELDTLGMSSWWDRTGIDFECTTCFDSVLTHGPIVGATDPDGVRLWLRTDATRQVAVRLATDAGQLAAAAPAAYRYPSPDRDFSELVHLAGLQPETSYVYAVDVDGVEQAAGSFTTAPLAGPTTMRFAFGSCALQSEQPIFGEISAMAPDAFFFLGDAHYGDTDDLAAQRQFYRTARTVPERRAMMTEVPTMAIWDDHDFVANNSDANDGDRDAARRAFTEHWANPSYGEADAGVYSSWWYGDIAFHIVDTRYFKNALPGSLLGTDQMDWLKAELARPATFHFLMTGSQWNREGSADSWAEYPDAWDELFGYIADEQIGGVVLLTGDVHHAEFRDVGGLAGGYTMPELTSSPLANTNLPCRSSNQQRTCDDSGRSYILVDVDTTLADPVATATIYNEGVAISSWDIARSSLEPRVPVITDAAAATDTNGDGFADLVVGIPGESASGQPAGGVQEIRGTTAGLEAARNRLRHQDRDGVDGRPESGDNLGATVAMGDFDDDGYVDAAIGVPLEDVGTTGDDGIVHFWYGSPDGLLPPTSLDFVTQADLGELTEDEDVFGQALATGDFDGDGHADIAIGSPGEDAGAGMVHTLYGGVGGIETAGSQAWRAADVGLTPIADDGFGAALATGDLDGDGYDDLAIGMPAANAGAGQVVVMFGSPTGLTGAAVVVDQDTPEVEGGAEAGDGFGTALAAGDLDGDGFDDLVVGVPEEDLNGVRCGAVIILPGSPTGPTGIGDLLYTPRPSSLNTDGRDGARFGAALAVLDANGDGLGDVAIGAPGHMLTGLADAGGVSLVFGDSATLATSVGSQFIIQADIDGAYQQAGDGFGAALGIGDYDGDGFADLAVGSPGEDIGGVVDAGAVAVVPGSTTGLDVARGQVWYQTRSRMGAVAANERFGASLPAGVP